MHFTYILNINITIDITISGKYRIDMLLKLKK